MNSRAEATQAKLRQVDDYLSKALLRAEAAEARRAASDSGLRACAPQPPVQNRQACPIAYLILKEPK